MGHETADASVLLQRARAGDREAESLLMAAVYTELHRLAERVFAGERPGHTLQPSVLISELYLRMMKGTPVEWQNTAHFYRTAAKTFRNILVDHARARNAQRRPNPRDRVPLEDVFVYSENRTEDVVAVHAALEQLAQQDEEQAAIMELRYFIGFTIEETARLLGVSATTVKTKHEFARAWLQSLLDGNLQP